MHQELPAMATMSYTSSTADLDQLMAGVGYAGQAQSASSLYMNQEVKRESDQVRRLLNGGIQHTPQAQLQPQKETNMSARIVKVFIVDSNDAVPLNQRVLYSGDEKLTDLTDQELFFEVPIKELLDKHNTEVRTKTVNKKVKDRTEYLEPARIRDLKMVVVNVATF